MRTDNLRVDIRHRYGVTIAHPVGVLDMRTYAPLRDILLKCAAEQPDGLIVEIEDLGLPVKHAISVFPLVSMRLADWPAVPLALVSPQRNSRRAALAAGNVLRFVQVYDSIPDALAGMEKPPLRRRAVLELPPSPTSTRRARHFVRMNCRRWDAATLITDAMTVATSFVENTLAHTDSAAFLRMELRRHLLTIAVSDDDVRLPVMRERVEGGVPPSGLLLVSAIAKVWGCVPTMSGGKTVWAVLRLPTDLTSAAPSGFLGE